MHINDRNKSDVMATTNIKTEIIAQLNFLSEESLREVKKYIQFLSFQKDKDRIKHTRKKKKKSENDFFEICGIWQDREIDSNSLRRNAWREIKW